MILMKIDFSNIILNDISYLVGSSENLVDFFSSLEVRKPFDSQLKQFVNAFSIALMGSADAKRYPDLVALAFWMRKSNIEKLEKDFFKSEGFRLPVGSVLHFAPSNVDTIFIYSLFLSLLVGNSNLVRVSEKVSPQKNILIELINKLLVKEEFKNLRDNLLILTYPHSDRISSNLSLKVNMRVIWGGDEAINKISSYPILPSSTELKFSDKYSMCLFNTPELTNLTDDAYERLIRSFVNDSYWFAQQGCSSPRSVLWLEGSEHTKTIDKFWDDVDSVSEDMFGADISLSDVMNKIVASYATAIDASGIRIKKQGHMLTRVQFSTLESHSKARELHSGAGLFYECNVDELSEAKVLFDRKVQTLSYFGFDELSIKSACLHANVFPDRVVPVGTALDFSIKWDGFDFLQSLTRNIDFR